MGEKLSIIINAEILPFLDRGEYKIAKKCYEIFINQVDMILKMGY